MFTGIVEEVGRILTVERDGDGLRFQVGAPAVSGTLELGDSVSVEGVCQTVVRRLPDGFEVQAIGTTLSRTMLAALRPGDEVNLERALALGERLGGHLVQGHVDAVGIVGAVRAEGPHVLMDVEVPDEVADVTVLHGSIALAGVSLTVNALPRPNLVQVALIPHTWRNTTLRLRAAGDRVNVEGDLFGKFVAHYLKRTGIGGV